MKIKVILTYEKKRKILNIVLSVKVERVMMKIVLMLLHRL